MAKATWRDDNGAPVKAVSAEQHALDNPTHRVTVVAGEPAEGFANMFIECTAEGCRWWDEQGVAVN